MTHQLEYLMPHPDHPTLTVVDHPLVAHKLSHMRMTSTSSKGFRELLREISLLLGYEVLRDLQTELHPIETPVGPTDGQRREGFEKGEIKD